MIHNREDCIDKDDLYLYTYGVAIPFIASLGIIGNIVSTSVLWINSHYFSSPSYVYLRWLTVADLLVMIFSIPLSITRVVGDEFSIKIIAIYSAHLSLYLINSLLSTSNLLVLCLTIERFLSICHPRSVNPKLGIGGYRFNALIVVGITVYSFLLQVPEIFSKTVEEVEPETSVNSTVGVTEIAYKVTHNTSLYDSGWYTFAWAWFRETTVKVIPILVIGVLNPLILRKYNRQKRVRNSMSSSQSGEGQVNYRNERRLTVLLGGACVTFLVCTTPSAIVTIMYTEETAKHFGFQVFMSVANCLELTNNALNFYVYTIASSDFRHQLRKVFCISRVGASAVATNTDRY